MERDSDSLASMNVDVENFTSFEAVFDTDLSVDEETLIPVSSRLLPAYPNPFNSFVTIPYDIHTKSNVSVIISNVLGQRTFSYNYPNQPAGNYKISWNGINDRNISVSGGVYIVTLKTDVSIDFKKIILLK